jgi:hypothetical protein
MQCKPCEAVIPLKMLVEVKPPSAEKECIIEELNEHQVLEFLSQNKDNIIVVFGQKIYPMQRSVIRKNIKKDENIFIDESENKYYQIVGRHLIDDKEIKDIIDKNLSIFNISTLKNVIRVKSKNNSLYAPRSVYNVEPYTVKEYEEMI